MPYWDNQKKKWIAQVYHQGKKYRSFHVTKSEAKNWEVKTKKEKRDHQENLRIRTVSLFDFASMYLDFSKSKHSKKTYEEKKFVFRLFLASVDPGLPVQELHKGIVLDYLQKQAESRSGNAANKDRKNLVASWNWAMQYIPDFPARNSFLVDRFPEKRTPRYIPPEKDFWKVHNVAESYSDQVMILAFLHLAARRNEIFNLRCEDVDFEMTRCCRLLHAYDRILDQFLSDMDIRDRRCKKWMMLCARYPDLPDQETAIRRRGERMRRYKLEREQQVKSSGPVQLLLF